jgi:alcohol dehydrogenase class IV
MDTSSHFSPFSPVEIHIEGAAAALARLEAFAEGRRGVLFIGERFLLDRLGLGPVAERLIARRGGLLFTGVRPNPDIANVCALLKALEGVGIELIIALGGGSSMDLAKAASVLHPFFAPGMLMEEAVRRAIAEKEYLHNGLGTDMVMVPTTAGTGSEVTKWATIWDPERNQKLSIDCDKTFARAALLVPEYTAAMPPRLTLATGLDALCHGMEAFWAVARTPLSQELALSAARQVKDALPNVLRSPHDLQARQRMLAAALTAGLAFSITRTTACHSMSYPLSMAHQVPHGFACAVTLAQVARRNQAAMPQIKELLAVFGGEEGLAAFLRQVSEGIQALRLSAFGIGRGDLPGIAEAAFTQGRMNNNPIVFTGDQVLEILEACY